MKRYLSVSVITMFITCLLGVAVTLPFRNFSSTPSTTVVADTMSQAIKLIENGKNDPRFVTWESHGNTIHCTTEYSHDGLLCHRNSYTLGPDKRGLFVRLESFYQGGDREVIDLVDENLNGIADYSSYARFDSANKPIEKSSNHDAWEQYQMDYEWAIHVLLNPLRSK